MPPTRSRAGTRQAPGAASLLVILRLTGFIAVTATAAALLAAGSGSPGAAWTALTTATTDPAGSADPAAPVVAAAALVAWACTGWLAVICLLSLACVLPGMTGRVAARLVRCCAPRAVRRVLAGALGVTTLLAAPSAAFAEQLPATRSPAPATSSELRLDWPVTSPSSPSSPPRNLAPVPVLPTASATARPAGPTLRPGSSAPASSAPAPALAPTTAPTTAPVTAPVTEPATAPPTAPPTAPRPATASAPVPAPGSAAAPAAAGTVIVRPGDSLWTVAARALGSSATPAMVAQAWPSWWAANRDAVGPDPDVIHPGDRLQPPGGPD